MTTCDDIELLIGPFEDGELEPHEMEEVAFHVVACLGCKAALEDYRELGLALRGAVLQPSLDGFASKVADRIDHSWIPLHVRFGRMREMLSRAGSIFEIAVIAAATAVLTIVIASPYAKKFGLHSPPSTVVASTSGEIAKAEPKTIDAPPSAPIQPVSISRSEPRPEFAPPRELMLGDPATSESQEVMTDLTGGEGPSVPVWNEPRTQTTVVYVPHHP
ncbi:MAG TPA: hypothetical protein VMT61_06625 [Candidatus Binataceae bacterium]|nr:hypothetical protein [Candidatus Binataceae bacterium]